MDLVQQVKYILAMKLRYWHAELLKRMRATQTLAQLSIQKPGNTAFLPGVI
ncbi:hypothetical protein [Pedobacter cryoconitis]|uniref:Uncharacterized protein n=1 Tax=Pedobacter cryoconitis TaxID=188932 RepID=A0A7X0J8P6_9SPHI|nr:hypothetical protein [Pedobacter cryoconitis]MBB6501942.1 hypothetical protein [Pedobacter cryoconitis]